MHGNGIIICQSRTKTLHHFILIVEGEFYQVQERLECSDKKPKQKGFLLAFPEFLAVYGCGYSVIYKGEIIRKENPRRIQH